MFASQLLKVLQLTIPSDVSPDKYDDIREIALEPNTTIKETRNNIMSRHNGDNDMAFGSKERYRFDSSGRKTNPFLLGQDEEHSLIQVEESNLCEEGDSCWSSSPSSSSWEKKVVVGKSWQSPDRKISSVEFVKEIIYHHEAVDDDDAYCFGGIKDELDCDVPELLVCYKDINYRIVDDDDDYGGDKHKLSIYGDDDEEGIHLDVSASDELTFPSSTRAIDYFVTDKLVKTNNDSVSTDGHFQISPRKEKRGNRSDLPAKEETEKIVETNSLCYESEVEDGIITFKFNSSSPVTTTSHIVNQISDRFKETSLDSAEFMQQAASKDSEGNTDIESSVIIKETKVDKDHHHHQPSSYPEKENPSKSRNQESINSSGLRQHRKPRQESSAVVSEDRNMDLSANRLITCIEAMERNGSQSIRSDGSRTSMRSFTFPVLKGEWDKSPRKMSNEADEKQHKRISRLYSCCGYEG